MARRIVIVACPATPPNILVLLGTPVCVEIGFLWPYGVHYMLLLLFLLFPFITRVSLSFLSGNSNVGLMTTVITRYKLSIVWAFHFEISSLPSALLVNSSDVVSRCLYYDIKS